MSMPKTPEGRCNLCGGRISEYRMKLGFSQNRLAAELQLIGIDIHKNRIQRIESGKAYVTDIELYYIARCLKCGVEDLIDDSPPEKDH